MKTQYIADDGTVFTSRLECVEYECKTSTPKDALMWDKNQQPISYKDFIDKPESVEYLWVRSEESLDILHYTWFCSIKEPGFYFFDNDKGWVNFEDLEEQYVNLSRFVCRVKQAEN